MPDNDINLLDQGVRDGTNIIEPEPTIEDLVELVQMMRRDWVALNDHLNRTATVHRWCSEYEERLEQYNYSFTVLKLQGRQQQARGERSDPYPMSRYLVAHRSPDICPCESCNAIRQRAQPDPFASGAGVPPVQLQEALERLQRILQQRGAL